MIDTCRLKLEELISYPLVAPPEAAKPYYPFSGWRSQLGTISSKNHYRKRRIAKWDLRMQHSETGIYLYGPVIEAENIWKCVSARINVPKLAGLPPGWLPDSDEDLTRAKTRLASALDWLPEGWWQRAQIKELHFTMNFDFSSHGGHAKVLDAHRLIRHPGIRKDPVKIDPSHSSSYLLGTGRKVTFYDKAKHLMDQWATELKVPVAELYKQWSPPPLSRLEMRFVNNEVLNKAYDEIPEPSVPAGVPPLPVIHGHEIRLDSLRADQLTQMLRQQFAKLGVTAVRTPKRYSAKNLIQVLERKGFRGPSGESVLEAIEQFLEPRTFNEYKKGAGSIDIGEDHFSWEEVLGTSGFGPYAVPKPEFFGGPDFDLQAPIV